MDTAQKVTAVILAAIVSVLLSACTGKYCFENLPVNQLNEYQGYAPQNTEQTPIVYGPRGVRGQ